jgi:hypothetical protein
MPWNPMRVEQRIGRIDRIGQIAPTVRIHNFYYDGTVEAKVYRKLRDRIDAFQSVVGNLQPILAQVPNFIEQAVMSADPAEEGVLLAEFDEIFDAPPLRPAVDDVDGKKALEPSQRTDGFDFLGWNFVVKPNGKFISTPSQKATSSIKAKVKEVMKDSRFT